MEARRGKYELCYLIAKSPKPRIALMDGNCLVPSLLPSFPPSFSLSPLLLVTCLCSHPAPSSPSSPPEEGSDDCGCVGRGRGQRGAGAGLVMAHHSVAPDREGKGARACSRTCMLAHARVPCVGGVGVVARVPAVRVCIGSSAGVHQECNT
eukprot:3548435-Rhodomonas_salina.1